MYTIVVHAMVSVHTFIFALTPVRHNILPVSFTLWKVNTHYVVFLRKGFHTGIASRVYEYVAKKASS